VSSLPKTFLTEAQYLEQERRAGHKSEYCQGEVLAMAGASRRHALIVGNLVRELGEQLKERPCEVYSSDMRLRVSPTRLYTYPDVLVVCGPPQFADDQGDTLLNPTVIIEVLSDSTSDYDRGRKFQHYRTLPSLAEYLTIAQDAPRVERWTRQPGNGWLLSEFSDLGQSVPLASISCVLPLIQVYHKIDFAPEGK
jgi:Uma2 family endonuclease